MSITYWLAKGLKPSKLKINIPILVAQYFNCCSHEESLTKEEAISKHLNSLDLRWVLLAQDGFL